MSKNVLFVMDPLETIQYNHDTSFALMLGLQDRGMVVHQCQPEHLFARYGVGAFIGARCKQIRVQYDATQPVTVERELELRAEDFALVLMRKDPPVDKYFVYATYLLDLFERVGGRVVNSPASLRNYNEKAVIFQFPDFMPASIVSCDRELIRTFVADHGGRAIIKPIDGFAGYGIMRLNLEDGNFSSILEMSTERGRQMTMVQEYLPAAHEGDKRVWLTGGEIMGQIIRVPTGSDFRGNMRAGAVAQGCDLTADETRIARAVGQKLLTQGVELMGLDLIGGRLTEINLTSPTGIQEIDHYTDARSRERTADYLVQSL